MTLDEKSIRRLAAVHPDLRRVIETAAAITTVDFTVTEGMRTLERQRQLLAAGATRTLKSRHLDGHAVDLAALVGTQIRWDWPLYHKLAGCVKVAAKQCKIPVEWGGAWETFPDGPHFQLPWKDYPI